MATANIKITALSDITSANMTYNDLVAVVDMNGTPETKKANIQLVGNLILNGAGGSYFPAAAQAVLAQNVTNAAQPNITSVGTLSSLAVTANVTVGNLSASGTVSGVLIGDGSGISNLQIGNIAGLGNIATVNLDGNVSNVFRGDGTFGPEGAGGNANYANFAGTAYAVDGANVSGEVGFAAVANSVALANVSGAGNIASINLDGNVSNVLRGDGTWDSDANSTYGDGNVVSLLAAFGSNTITTTGLVTADLGGGSNIIGANVTGEVSFAATANAVAYANVSGTPTLGNISTINLDGNASNVLRGDGTFGADANSSYGDSNVVTLLGSFGSNTVDTTGNISAGNLISGGEANVYSLFVDAGGANVNGNVKIGGDISNVEYIFANANISTNNNFVSLANVYAVEGIFTGNVGAGNINSTGGNFVYITGNGSALTALTGANVTGEVSFAATANAVALANVSGAGNIASINLDGNVSNVLRGDGTFGADANSSYGDSNVVSLLGSFGSNTITTTGNVAFGNVDASSGDVAGQTGTFGLISGALTSPSQANITEVGTLSNLVVSGNIQGNVNGFSIGYLEIPQVALTADDTIALEDSGKHFHSNTAGNITLTIPTNATVAFPVGTAISIVEEAAGNILVNAAAGVNLYLAGNSTAANRVLGSYGMATLMKVGTDTWFINGSGVA